VQLKDTAYKRIKALIIVFSIFLIAVQIALSVFFSRMFYNNTTYHFMFAAKQTEVVVRNMHSHSDDEAYNNEFIIRELYNIEKNTTVKYQKTGIFYEDGEPLYSDTSDSFYTGEVASIILNQLEETQGRYGEIFLSFPGKGNFVGYALIVDSSDGRRIIICAGADKTDIFLKTLLPRMGILWSAVIVVLVLGALVFRLLNHKLWDIVKEVAYKRELEQKQSYQSAILDCSQNFINVVNLDGEVIYASPSSYDFVGFDPDSDQTTMDNVIAPEDIERIKNEVLPQALKDERWVGETVFLHKDGHRIPVEQTVFAVKDSNSQIIGYGTIASDISERVKNAEAVNLQLERNRLLFRISSNFSNPDDFSETVMKNLSLIGSFMGVDSVYVARYNLSKGISSKEHVWFADSLSEEEKTFASRDYKITDIQGLSEKESVYVTDDTDLQDGTNDEFAGYVRAYINVPLFISGERWGILGVCMKNSPNKWSESDIRLVQTVCGILSNAIERNTAHSNLVDTRAKISEALFKLTTIMKNYPGIIWCTDEKGIVNLLDGQGLKTIGLDSINIIGKKISYVRGFFPLLDDETAKMFSLPGNNSWFVDLGKTIIKCMTSDLLDENKNVIGRIGISDDITEMVTMQTDLRNAIEAAETASNAKSDFLSRMSHEIRTPMNAIIGMTRIAENTDEISKMHYCLGKIDEASKHLLGLINDILDLSKIEANKLEIVSEQFNIEQVLEKVCTVVTVKMEEKKQQFFISVDKNLPPNIISDELRITQVITNLLTNAVKFTDEGGSIKLNIFEKERRDDKWIIQFSITDNGIGMSKEQQSRMFQAFEQAEGGTARKYGGTGLGLAICKRLVEMMNGEIWLESELGKGTTFSFTIEAGQGIVTRTVLDENINRSQLRVLAVDDSEDIRDYFLSLMEKFNIDCTVAESGESAVEYVKKGLQDGNPYNLVFIDWMMPGIDGVETCRQIKKITGDSIVAIMISIASLSEVEEAAKGVFVDKFISKPLLPSTILNAINELMGMPSGKSEENTLKSSQYSFSHNTVLFVEDVDINREFVISLLEDTPLELVEAENGKIAFDLFSKNPDKYDLILMDVHMPVMDGLTATRKIRKLKHPKASEIPIIAMTANAFREDIDKCIEAGMDFHIAKPIDCDVLFEKLYFYLKDVPERNADSNEKPFERPPCINYADFVDYIDIKTGLVRLNDNKKLYLTILESYKGQQMLDELRSHVKAGEFKPASVVAGALKGVAANLSLTAVYSEMSRIEKKIEKKLVSLGDLEPLCEIISATTDYIEKILESGGI